MKLINKFMLLHNIYGWLIYRRRRFYLNTAATIMQLLIVSLRFIRFDSTGRLNRNICCNIGISMKLLLFYNILVPMVNIHLRRKDELQKKCWSFLLHASKRFSRIFFVFRNSRIITFEKFRVSKIPLF